MKTIPVTGFAAAIMLGGPLSAVETASKGSSMTDQKGQSQMQSRTSDRTDHASFRPMTAAEVLGMNIDTTGNEKIGEIDEIFIDSNTGEVLAMVVSTGGFLGMGQEQTLISPEDLRLNTDRTLMNADLSKDQIRTAPRYKAGETARFDRVRPLGKTRSDSDTRNERNESAVSELIGMSVENRQGDVIGDVDEVFLDLEKREVAGVVVSTGGFLGMGDRKTLFGMRELSFDRANEKVVLDYNRDQIRGFPEYKVNDQSVFANLGDRMDRLVEPRSNNYNARTAVGGERIDTRNGVATVRGSSAESDVTVFDQGNSSDEIAMTASIRTAIREDDALSNRANNVTIITRKGKVVLRGEVDSVSEKNTVENIAQNKAGRQNVTSELIVASR